VKFARVDIMVHASATVRLSSSSGDGYKAYVMLVNLDNNTFTTTWGSWGGANMFNPNNAVDLDTNAYALPGNGVAITGHIGGTGPVSAILHIPASMTARILPPKADPLPQVELVALYCFTMTGGSRKEELSRRRVLPSTVDGLVARGLLKRNKAGACSMTTDGRNALGDFNGR
jgi:hypothetical protein